MRANPSAEITTGRLDPASNDSFRLSEERIDIWKISLSCSQPDLAHAHQVLSPDEQQRAARIGSTLMRNAFIGARASLRFLLGRYLQCSPGSIRFAYESHGKPVLIHDAGLCFSTTRSSGMAAFAFCLHVPVGIDMERIRIIPNMDRVIERMFSPQEKRQLNVLPTDQRQRAFFACWVRKEAYAKATGKGILTRFDAFCVDTNPAEPRPQIRFDPATAQDWILRDLRLDNEYAAALSYRGAERELLISQSGSLNQLIAINSKESLQTDRVHLIL
jgi:4'-phosphopantetheinyl transferase